MNIICTIKLPCGGFDSHADLIFPVSSIVGTLSYRNFFASGDCNCLVRNVLLVVEPFYNIHQKFSIQCCSYLLPCAPRQKAFPFALLCTSQWLVKDHKLKLLNFGWLVFGISYNQARRDIFIIGKYVIKGSGLSRITHWSKIVGLQ